MRRSLKDAIARYNADHRRDWGRPGHGTCPACEHHLCFGRLPQNTERWACFSANHTVTCGHKRKGESDGCFIGDALDLDAHAASRTPVDHLRATGYLAPMRQKVRGKVATGRLRQAKLSGVSLPATSQPGGLGGLCLKGASTQPAHRTGLPLPAPVRKDKPP